MFRTSAVRRVMMPFKASRTSATMPGSAAFQQFTNSSRKAQAGIKVPNLGEVLAFGMFPFVVYGATQVHRSTSDEKLNVRKEDDKSGKTFFERQKTNVCGPESMNQGRKYGNTTYHSYLA